MRSAMRACVLVLLVAVLPLSGCLGRPGHAELFDEMRALMPRDGRGLSLSYQGLGLTHLGSPVAPASLDLPPGSNLTEVLEGVRANATRLGWDAGPIVTERQLAPDGGDAVEVATFHATRGDATLEARAEPRLLRLQITFR
jgi:hypothetical protein